MHKTPRQLPSLPTILADLDSRRPLDVARYLGVSERTVYGWIAADQCPRPAHLALFWVSRWGESIIHTEAHNSAIWHATHAAALARELAAIKRTGYPSQPSDRPAANAPTFSASPSSQIGLFDFWQVSA
jgi:predicted DNA-binding transcriptional regulator AlpA